MTFAEIQTQPMTITRGLTAIEAGARQRLTRSDLGEAAATFRGAGEYLAAAALTVAMAGLAFSPVLLLTRLAGLGN